MPDVDFLMADASPISFPDMKKKIVSASRNTTGYEQHSVPGQTLPCFHAVIKNTECNDTLHTI